MFSESQYWNYNVSHEKVIMTKQKIQVTQKLVWDEKVKKFLIITFSSGSYPQIPF